MSDPVYKPSFSIVINTLNRANYLNDAIAGVCQLDYPSFELIVVNGPSTDHTDEVLAPWGDQIKLRNCDVPNLSVSRNVGIAAADGDIVAFLDDDAVPHPDWLNRLSPHYADPIIGAVGGFTVDNTGVRWQVRKTICDRYGNAHFVDDLFDERRLNFPRTPFYPSLLGTNSSFRRRALYEIGGFDHTFAYMLDETDVCLRLVDAGWHVRYESEALIFHQYAESHVRSTSRKPRTLYPSVVSKSYFISMHGGADGNVRQAQMLHDFREEILRANKWLAEHSEISPDHRISLDQDVLQGIEAGVGRSVEAKAIAKSVGDLAVTGADAPFLPIFPKEGLRVALISQGYPPENDAGIAQWTALLARGLADLGVQVHVITCTAAATSRRFVDGIWLHKISPTSDGAADISRTYDLPDSSLSRWMAAVKQEVRFLKTFGLDLVSFPIWDLEGLPLLDDPDLAAVMSLHTTYRLARPFKPEWDLRVVFGRRTIDKVIAAESAALARAPNLLANSQTIVDQVEAGYGLSLEGRHRIVPHGTPDLLAGDGLSLDGKLADGARRNTIRVLVPARFELRKGYDLALRLAQAMSGTPSVHFDFVGEDVDANVAAHAAQDSGVTLEDLSNVTLHGKVDRPELDALYRASDVVLMPSRFESFGLVAIEGMSAGAPVIALAAGALPEVIEDKHSGWLFDEADFVTSSAGILHRLLASRALLETMSRQAYATFEKRFSVAVMACEVLKVYQAAVAAKQEQV